MSSSHSLEEIWRSASGLYQCPKDSSGKRLGPLVGYAATYDQGGERVHYVGEAFYNFAAVEELPRMLDLFAEDIATKIGAGMERPDWVLGAPLGGLLLAQRVAGFLDCRCLYAEKKVTAVATNGQRESAELIFGRHLPPKDTRGIGIEDVFNNFSTTGELFSLVEEHGATLIGMAGALNRSDRTSLKEGGKTIPVVSALQIPSAQFRQDDPAVADDIRRGNVVWKPKVEWERLMRAMTQQIASPHDVARLSPRPVSH